jgi:hypothetical protein
MNPFIQALSYFLAALGGSFVGTIGASFLGHWLEARHDKARLAALVAARDAYQNAGHFTSLNKVTLNDDTIEMLHRLDVDAFLKIMPLPDEMSDFDGGDARAHGLMLMHMIRSSAPMFSPRERDESHRWLVAHGAHPMDDQKPPAVN